METSESRQASALTQLKGLSLGFPHTRVVGSQTKGYLFLVLPWGFSPTSCSLAGFDGCVIVSESGPKLVLPGWFGAPLLRAIHLGSSLGLERVGWRDQSRGGN